MELYIMRCPRGWRVEVWEDESPTAIFEDHTKRKVKRSVQRMLRDLGVVCLAFHKVRSEQNNLVV